jgi:hypothetical protein
MDDEVDDPGDRVVDQAFGQEQTDVEAPMRVASGGSRGARSLLASLG